MARRRLLPGADARQGLVALALNSSTSLVAGAMLGSLTATFERRPGLLVLIPAAIGLRGNVFGSLGNRVSTSIHAGELQLRLRRSTVLGQNVLAAGALTLGMSLVLVVLAALVAVGLGLGASIGLADLALVSVGGGALASIPVLAATLGLAGGAVRYGWDLDNVTAPLVSSFGDVLTLPALYLATGLLGLGLVTSTLGWALAAVAVVALVAGARSSLPQLRRIVRTSIPVLVIAGLVSSLAGVALERRLDDLRRAPRAPDPRARAPLERRCARGDPLRPPVQPAPPRSRGPDRPSRRAAPGATSGSSPGSACRSSSLNGVGANVVARLLGEASPGLAQLVGASLLSGAARDGRRDGDRLLRHDRHRPAGDRPRHLRHPDGQLHRRPRRCADPRRRHRHPRAV